MPYKVKLKREAKPDILLSIDEGGALSFNSTDELVFIDIDNVCRMLRVVIEAMRSNVFTTVEVEVE